MMYHEASAFDGLDIREYTAIELGILQDIGYTNAAIPEPTMIGFAALAGLGLLRRRVA